MRGKILAATFGLVLACGPATLDSSFERADANDDGQLSRSEFQTAMNDKGRYGDWDLDDDDRLDAREFGETGFDADFGAWDVDRDGYLDSDEFTTGAYDAFDDDESGHWDAGEWDDAGDAGIFDV